MTALPLTFRLPNPPPTLIGREADVERVAAAIRRSPLVICHGPDGIGKTALALHVVRHAFPEAADDAVLVRAAPGEPLAATISGAFARILGGAAAAGDEGALELAETARRWVVIDGADDPSWTFAALAARYARVTRWIVTSRHVPSEAVLEHAVAIAPYDEATAAALAAKWCPELGEAERALVAVAARGSSARLRRLVADRIARGPDAMIDADPPGRRVLDLLAATDLAIPAAIARELAPGATAATLAALAERGLVAIGDSGIELHRAARALIVSQRGGDPGALAIPLARRLATIGDVPAVSEAIRLGLVGRDHELAAELLARDGARLLGLGFAPRLAQALLASHDPRLASWRLRAAVEIGDSETLPDPDDASVRAHSPEDRLLWAEALVRANRIDAAISIAATVEAPTARLLAARGHSNRGRLAATLDELARIDDTADVPQAVAIGALALRARVEALSGHRATARAGIAGLRARLASLPAAIARDALQVIASTHHDLGELDATEAALDPLERELDDDSLGRFVSRRARLVRACVRVERGALEVAAGMLADLEQASRFASLHRPFIAVISATLAHARGDLARARSALDSLDDVDVGLGYVGAWAAALASRIAIVDPAAIAPRVRPEDHGLWPTVARLHLARLELRRDHRTSDVSTDLALEDVPLELWFAARALAWELALVAGDAARSLAIAGEVADRCADAGFALFEAEAVAGAIDAAVVAGDVVARDAAIARLDRIATRIGSPRFAAEARLARELAGEAAPERLEVIASGGGAPCVRRARLQLGDSTGADPIDRAVCAALPVRPVAIAAGRCTGWAPGWGVDRRRRCAWRPDGTRIDLADKPQLWRLLDALVDSPSGLDKEALVERAWAVPYHPLRHDRLLHNSIHKLRKLIEDEPATPRRLSKTDDGYRLGDDMPARVVDDPDRIAHTSGEVG